MKVGVIGVGFVGKATADVFKEKHEILLYDKYKEEMKDPSVLKESEIILLAVPTPMKDVGEIDYSAIHDSMEVLEGVFKGIEKDKRPLIILRSTAVPGTSLKLIEKYNFNFAFNPEFLREKYALEDMKNTTRVVLGAERKEDLEIAKKMYFELFPKANYILTDTKTSEMIKYMANIMLAGQITIANQFYQICQRLGMDYDKVKEAVLLDERIGRNIDVPGHDGDFGFGGKCFPKDLNAMIYLARELKYPPYLLEEIWRSNLEVRKDRDWEKIPGATSTTGFKADNGN